MTPRYSVIVPVYNRPTEVAELLASLARQQYSNFEVVLVEDGSAQKSDAIARQYADRLTIQYFYKTNGGPGPARNYGAERAAGQYFIFLDSDCLVPPGYFEALDQHLANHTTDAFGGPDAAHPDFTPIQKAINYAMTAFITTGGIRGGGKASMEKFKPRSFNMGMTRQAFQQTGGFAALRFGEDIDLSLRIEANNLNTALVERAFVYHKRRTDFKKFYKQIFNSGMARIVLNQLHPGTLKVVHLLPTAFTLGVFGCVALAALLWHWWPLLPMALFITLVLGGATLHNKSLWVGLLAVPAAFIQLMAYGFGFIKAFWMAKIRRRRIHYAFLDNFYE